MFGAEVIQEQESMFSYCSFMCSFIICSIMRSLLRSLASAKKPPSPVPRASATKKASVAIWLPVASLDPWDPCQAVPQPTQTCRGCCCLPVCRAQQSRRMSPGLPDLACWSLGHSADFASECQEARAAERAFSTQAELACLGCACAWSLQIASPRGVARMGWRGFEIGMLKQ